MCVVKTLLCLHVRTNMHTNEVPGSIWWRLDAFQSFESSKECLSVGELWRWVSVCAHLHVLQHSSTYDLHQLCCSACSCQQLHLLLFCQTEYTLLVPGNGQCQLPVKALPKTAAELRDVAPWFSLCFATGLLQCHNLSPLISAASLSLSFCNLISISIITFGTSR